MHSLLIVDDDDVSREVMELLATEAGFACSAADSGQAALELLAGGTASPDIALVDLQMPGLAGESLARLLRSSCGPATVLLAMSGSAPGKDRLGGFDGFLLKPFTMNELHAALAGHERTLPPADQVSLNEAIYESLAGGMPLAQLHALYTLCLNDAERRLLTMQTATQTRDEDAYRRAAHAIKGGCGMVGATELAAMASAMERDGPPAVGNMAPFEEFSGGIARLRRMLNARNE